MNAAEITALARSLIEDPNAEYCSHAELDLYYDETALDFTRRTHVMRTSMSLAYDTTGLVSLNADVLEVLRLLDSNNRVINRISHPLTGDGELPYVWETTTATVPTHYFRSLSSPNQLRLYPRPTATGTATLYYVQQHRPGYSLTLPARHHMGLAWGIAAMALMKSSKPSDEARMKRFAALYEAEVIEALGDHAANFESQPPDIPYRYV